MPVYRSIITAYQAGLPSMSGQLSDSLSKRLFASNYPLFKLYSIAMGLPSYWSSKRIVLNDSSIQHYQIHNYRTEAPRKAFCYELLLPVGSPKDMKAMLLADLERTFNISARLEEQELSCLVLKAIGDTGHLFDEHQAAAETGKQSIRHRPMSYLIDYLDRQSDLPVLDETGIKGNIDMDFKGSTQLPEQLNQSLAVYGLKATVQARKMQVMVLYHQ